MFYTNFDGKLALRLLSYTVTSTLLVIFLGIFVINRKLRNHTMDNYILSERIKNYKPKPLVNDRKTDLTDTSVKNTIFNFAKVDFLSLSEDEAIKNEVAECIRMYGVGTCGPRSFLGSTDIHFALETSISKFLNTEDAIVYSSAYFTVSSSIACYCKTNDVIFIDDLCNIAIQQGISSTKSEKIFFDHNDFEAFSCLLEKLDGKYRRRKKILILEGIYARDGSICPLKEFIDVCKRFKVRIFIDESISFGTLGQTGRGITEYFDIDINEIDMIVASLETALYSVGGFCAGPHVIIESQRLNSGGYVFSASLCTYNVKAALLGLEKIEDKPEKLRLLSVKIDAILRSIEQFNIKSHRNSPVKVFNVKNDEKAILANKLKECLEKHEVYLLTEGGNLKMNLYINFGKYSEYIDQFYDIVNENVKEILCKY